jgi:hypothetical protein
MARHPWVDAVDLKIFLVGFDEGEQSAFRMDNEHKNATLELRT